MSKNQVRAAHFTPAEEQLYDGIDMNTIRKIPDVGSEVEKLLSLIKAKVPSLDSRPSLVAGQVLPKPNPLDIGPGAELDEFVYHRKPDGTLRKVMVVKEPVSVVRAAQVSLPGKGTLSDPDTSSDDECDMAPRVQVALEEGPVWGEVQH